MSEQASASGAQAGSAREPAFKLGVDLLPLDDERRGYADWYDRDMDAELSAVAAAGMTLARVFVSWKRFEPQVGQYDDDAFTRMDAIMSAARAHHVRVLVCMLADDRLAEMTDVPWGRRRDPRTDDYLVQREVALVQRVVNRYRAESAVWAWQLCDEAFASGFANVGDLERWAAVLRDAVREVDPDRPVLLGVDAETLLRGSGVDARAAVAAGELAASHVTAGYLAYAADGPQDRGAATYLAGFLLRLAPAGMPLLADGIGAHSLDASPLEECAMVRTALCSALMNGASVALLRRFRDLATEKREPYFRDPFEVLVGLLDTDGAPKPVLAEARRFAHMAAHIDLDRYERAAERAAVLLPAERYRPLPSLAGLYDPRACLRAFIAAKEAHLPVRMLREGEPLTGCEALFVPSAFELAPETWRALAAFVQGGGSVVMSYGGGDADRGVREVFGVEFLGDGGARETLVCRVAQPGVLGELEAFDARLDLPAYALLGHGDATVVATDATGSPLLTVNRYGQGRAVFIAAPLERALAQGDPLAAPPQAVALLRTVYGAVARAAGAGPLIGCDRSEVEIALLSGENDDVLLLLNHAPVALTATIGLERTVAGVTDVRGGATAKVDAASFGVPIGANGMSALRLSYA